MARDRAPGVYFEPADPPPRSVTEVRTDIAGFVGVAERGPLHRPVKVESWTQFLTRFGGPIPQGLLAYAVRGFFANGGRTCWVVRVASARPDAPRARIELVNRYDVPVFLVESRDPGPGSERISVRVEPATAGRFSLSVRVGLESLEAWRDLSPVPDSAGADGRGRYAVDLINGLLSSSDPSQPQFEEPEHPGSLLIRLTDLQPRWPGSAADKAPAGVESGRRYGGGRFPRAAEGRLGATHPADRADPVLDGLRLEHFTGEDQPPDVIWGLKALEAVDEVSLVAIPDLMWTEPLRRPRRPIHRCHVLGETTVPDRVVTTDDPRHPLTDDEQRRGQLALIRHCERQRDRFAVLDAPPRRSVEEVVAWATGRDGLRSESGRNAGLYYPWVYVPDPLGDDPVYLVPPSGHVCGMFARVDLGPGVQKPPANETLEEVQGVDRETDAIGHGWLNDVGINAIRPFGARGVRVMGARTLAGPDQPEWRYVNVRRLVLMIEESLDQASQFLVFEPNRPDKWREVDRVVRVFLDDIWRRGRLDGATAEDAFQVVCDRSTNQTADVDAGRMTCLIAVRPPLPSEFVFVRLGQRVGETGAAQRGRRRHG